MFSAKNKDAFASNARLELLKKMRSSAAKNVPIKAEVMGDSPESVKKGLDLASDVMDKKASTEGLGSDEETLTDSPKMEDESEVELSDEESSEESKIAELEAKLASMEERLSKLGV